jgi:hypothetical protein
MQARTTVNLELLVCDVLVRLGVPSSDLEAASGDIRELADIIRGSPAQQPPRGGSEAAVAAQVHAATTAAARDVGLLADDDAAARACTLALIDVYLAQLVSDTQIRQAARHARELFGRILVAPTGSDAIWSALAWQWPAWRAHLADDDYGKPTYEVVRSTCSSAAAATWLTDRIVEEAALHGAAVPADLARWLLEPAALSPPASTLRQRRRYNRMVELARLAIDRSQRESLPRCVWTEAGPYPPANWGGHWLTVDNSPHPARVADVVAATLDSWPRIWIATPPAGAGRQPKAHDLYDRHFS